MELFRFFFLGGCGGEVLSFRKKFGEVFLEKKKRIYIVAVPQWPPKSPKKSVSNSFGETLLRFLAPILWRHFETCANFFGEKSIFFRTASTANF